MKRAFVFAAVLLAVPLPATAAQRDSPVQGGGSFTEAPLLDEGNYSDTIRLTEELFYAVELSEGQGMKVVAQLRGERNGPKDAALLGQLQVYSTLRDRWPPNELEGFDGVSNSSRWSIGTPEVGGDGDGSSSDAEFFAQPGTYYFSLRLYRSVGLDRDSPVRRREFKTRLKVEVTGVALDPSPTPTEDPSPTPTEEEPSPEVTESEEPGSAAGPNEPASSDTPYLRVYLMTFLIGLLLGFAIVVGRAFAGRSASTRRA
jgi:Ca-activated chloride channel homolog